MTHLSDQQSDQYELSDTSKAMLALTEQVIDEWTSQVRKVIGEARGLAEPILVDTLPTFYANIAEAVTDSYPREFGGASSTVPMEHGGERARLTGYNAESLIHEYQVFGRAITAVLTKNGVILTEKENRIVVFSIDEAIREAVSSFDLTHAMIRERFVASLTHDLRSPLTAMRMTAELINRKTDSDHIRFLANRLVETSGYMDRLIKTLLDSITADSGEELRLDVTQMKLSEVIDPLREQYLSHVGVTLRYIGEDVTGFWSKESLRRAIDNVVGNAIKYGDEQYPITIRSTTSHGRLILSIHNQGEVIPLADMETIFKVFSRSSSAKSKGTTGWGIGLPFVRAVAESHGGSIAVDSAEGRGTTFTIDIPIDARPFQDQHRRN